MPEGSVPMKALFIIGRLIFGGFFIYSGIHHFRDKAALGQYASSKNLPQPELAVMASGAAILAGGTSVILGLGPRFGALAITLFLASVSPLMHDFWNSSDPAARQSEMINFSKNMALLGAALALAGVEEWPVSICG